MTTARLLLACVALPLALVYAGGLVLVAIAGSCFHRTRIAFIARINGVSPIAVLLTCALLWPVVLRRALRERLQGGGR